MELKVGPATQGYKAEVPLADIPTIQYACSSPQAPPTPDFSLLPGMRQPKSSPVTTAQSPFIPHAPCTRDPLILLTPPESLFQASVLPQLLLHSHTHAQGSPSSAGSCPSL